MSKVRVYEFTQYTISNDGSPRGKRLGTREAIAKLTDNTGVPIEESEQEVDSSQLDIDGFLKN